MRTIKSKNPYTIITSDDPDTAGGLCHEYEVKLEDGTLVASISFQCGPMKEAGVNGLQHIDLLAICQDRLRCAQAGALASSLNDVTGGFIGAAIASEEERRDRRELAGVEGTSAA